MNKFAQTAIICLATCLLFTGCNFPANQADATKTAQADQAQNVLKTAQANVFTILTQTAAAKSGVILPTSAPVVGKTQAPVVIPTIGATQKPAPGNTGNDAATLAGETVPDGTKFISGTSFTKVWRLMNTGSTTWSDSYKLVFFEGDQMGATKEFRIPVPVEPGKIIDMSVPMKAPDVVGSYKGFWKILNPEGKTFGPGGTGSFWVKIEVVAPTATPTTAPTATPTSTSIPPTVTTAPIVEPTAG
jgi:hypothetical protein